jgi:inosose dehydratase
MSKIKFGFQTYTWQMSYDKYAGEVPHILDIIREGSGEGIEIEVCMMGKYMDDPALFKEELEKRDIKFAALCLVCDWLSASETDEEMALADKSIAFVKYFEGTKLALCQMPQSDRENLTSRQKNVLACINAVSKRAVDEGVICTYHPNSPPGSIFRTADDYEIMIAGLDRNLIGYTPDSGHIENGGMDTLSIIKKYRDCINHVHFKDIDANGNWVAMGDGITDFPAIVKYLNETDYDGWIMTEEESAEAEKNPDEVTIKNGEYICSTLK